MKIENDFEVAAPIDEVWAAMLDADKVAACVPGAQVLDQLGPDLYQFGMKIKIGPVSMQYKGESSSWKRTGPRTAPCFGARARRRVGTATPRRCRRSRSPRSVR